MAGGGLAMASPYECRGNGIRAIHHVLPERLRTVEMPTMHK